MKKLILVLAIISLLTSCLPTAPTVHQHFLECKMSNEEILKNISALMMQKNMQIKISDSKIGYLQAEDMPVLEPWTGCYFQHVWQFTIINDTIIATAKNVVIQKNIFGKETGAAEKYYNDDSHESHDWYWDVRQKLELICKNKIVIKDYVPGKTKMANTKVYDELPEQK